MHYTGLSRQRFEALANSEEVFLFPTCQREGQQETITLLKGEVAALRAELLLAERFRCGTESEYTQSTGRRPSKEARSSWNVVAGRGRKRPFHKRREKARGTAERKDTNKLAATQSEQPSSCCNT